MVAAWSNVVEQRVQPPAPGHSSLETMTHEYYNPREGIYQHYACAKNGKVLLCNDSDGEYEQVFGSREELQRFVDHLMAVADEAWNEYCEASLDLSNQDDVVLKAVPYVELISDDELSDIYTKLAEGFWGENKQPGEEPRMYGFARTVLAAFKAR